MLPITQKIRIDRLPVIIVHDNMKKLLKISVISNSNGKEEASAICHLLEDWYLTSIISRLQILNDSKKLVFC
jgi:hypothetical protein